MWIAEADSWFPRRGAPTPEFGVKTYYLARYLPKTAWKCKKLDQEGRASLALPWICQWIGYIVERLHGHNWNISNSRRLRLYVSHCKYFETSPRIEFYLRCSSYLLVLALSNEKIPLHLCHFKRSRHTISLNLFLWVA